MKTMNRRKFLVLTSLCGLAQWLGIRPIGGATVKKELILSNTRGHADHGWLKSKHSFSFASYYDPNRMGFGLLRVLNDDILDPKTGFGTHPHQNMEIVSIPLRGALKHKDSEGNESIIQNSEAQLMSAGTGVYHSEYNASEIEDANFLQIWVLPEKKDIPPRYDQKKFDLTGRKNQFQTVVSPMDKDDSGVKINQQAYFSLASLEQGKSLDYKLHSAKNGVYLFLIEGELEVAGEKLKQRDALSLVDLAKLELKATKNAEILLIEVPMV